MQAADFELELDQDPWAHTRARERRARRGGQPIPAAPEEGVAEEARLRFTYRPARHEALWLQESLRPFVELQHVEDVLSLAKGGKEANVYCCRAPVAQGGGLVAAKVYRPRQFRQLRNDAVYRQGRALLTPDGKGVHRQEERLARAVARRTAFGEQARHTSWLLYEYHTLQLLHAAGGAVPRPLATADNALLMEYLGDEHRAAPSLSEINLQPREVRPLFREVLRNLRLMAGLGIVHGDLSAYNLLYHARRVYFIDFPQVVNCATNPHAREILERDVRRVCEYFTRQGLQQRPAELAAYLWELRPDDPLEPLPEVPPLPDDEE